MLPKTCPLAAVDRRLADALRLWIRARESYFDPDGFRTDVQSAIQAFRSVTWILQKEKNLIPRFDEWYASKQAEMKGDPILRWLVDARNHIEKCGDLNTRSTVRTTTYAGWLDSKAHEMDLPPTLTSAMLARALAKSLPHDKNEDGTIIRVERRWVDSELPDLEILEALTHVYGKLQLLVFEAHGLFHEPLIAICPFQARLKSSNFVLPQEMLHPFERHQWIDAKSGNPIHVRYGSKTLSRAQAYHDSKNHYGPAFPTEKQPGDRSTFRGRCEFFFSMAKLMMERDGYHHSTALLEKGPQSQIVQFRPTTRAEKHAYLRDIAELAKRISCDSVMLIGEIWTASVPVKNLATVTHAADVAERGEALLLVGLHKDGTCFNIRADLMRQDGKVVFAGAVLSEGETPNLMVPFRAALGLDQQRKPEQT